MKEVDGKEGTKNRGPAEQGAGFGKWVSRVFFIAGDEEKSVAHKARVRSKEAL